jgi:hypothetical protein
MHVKSEEQLEKTKQRHNPLTLAMTKRQSTVLISGIVLTALYWVVALWYTNKQAYSKDLVVFHALFGNGASI